jgi:hypothetical protein
MENAKSIALLKQNFNKVEQKHADFFLKGVPRWPGESRDYLRNHHKNLDDIPLGSITFERLNLTNLPEPIMDDLMQAFNAFGKGMAY